MRKKERKEREKKKKKKKIIKRKKEKKHNKDIRHEQGTTMTPQGKVEQHNSPVCLG